MIDTLAFFAKLRPD